MKTLVLKYISDEGGSEEGETTTGPSCTGSNRSPLRLSGGECGSAWSRVRVTLNPFAEDQPLTLPCLSVPGNSTHSFGARKPFSACALCSRGSTTQKVQGSCQTLQTLETNLQGEHKKELNHPGLKMLSGQLKTDKPLWQDEHVLLCRHGSSKSHSACVVVTLLPTEPGQTTQKVKTGALGGRAIFPSCCTKGTMSQLWVGRGDLPSYHQEEHTSVLHPIV